MDQKLSKLEGLLKQLYQKNKKKLLFHGWHHINFVRAKAAIFARELKVDTFIVQSAALVHDLNYIVKSNSNPEAGRALRKKVLQKAGYSKAEVAKIEEIIISEHTAYRHGRISKEAQALSDADTLFKVLPTTPILFASKYISENKLDIVKLARKICSEHSPLIKKDIFFYSNLARRNYMKLAKIHLALWQNVEESLKDKDVSEMLTIAHDNGVFN